MQLGGEEEEEEEEEEEGAVGHFCHAGGRTISPFMPIHCTNHTTTVIFLLTLLLIFLLTLLLTKPTPLPRRPLRMAIACVITLLSSPSHAKPLHQYYIQDSHNYTHRSTFISPLGEHFVHAP